ncbi:hypothetical protein [Asticcacaulis sp.]|uniref:hypothetical protein n=1 Tax=Asticcacaulis sp. TaxID=1872648 RepID=UPI002CF60100|nr:hypothetical protein [Asticcacaulis sp.]HTM81241.1 hypothetical protein [Asticcacaulis sp.]
MDFHLRGQDYTITIGSDIVRDGMYLEVENPLDDVKPLFDIFYSDQIGEMFITTFKEDIPLEVMEWAISMARLRLIPKYQK